VDSRAGTLWPSKEKPSMNATRRGSAVAVILVLGFVQGCASAPKVKATHTIYRDPNIDYSKST
jgi:hypothetical protein